MNADQPTRDPSLSLSIHTRIDEICSRFEKAHQAGEQPLIEHHLGDVHGPARAILLRELLTLDIAYRRLAGHPPSCPEYEGRFPDQLSVVRDVFSARPPDLDLRTRRSTAVGTNPSSETRQNRDATGDSDLDDQPVPETIDRYEIRSLLGEGSFGTVYLAYDADLQRQVAIKTPRSDRVSRKSDIEMYLNEARVVASLDHPAIVPVHDFGRTDDGLCYVVSKYIEGRDLDQRIGQQRPSAKETAEIVATVAEALHHAHTHGLVHRDIKPANILIDQAGKPYVADFGLALKDEDFGTGGGFAGTPAYMSPEQARGEGHLVDGRSDIFSLGIVLYQMLTGVTPFRGSSWQEVTERVKRLDARPPRQVDDTIPKELERICLKALSKRATERYPTAQDMADDVRLFLAERTAASDSRRSVGSSIRTSGLEDSLLRPLHIVPKGLRSFDRQDADFYLELLPGPYDRDGLPASIRFWKTRVEELDPDRTFRIGLIYGPSGCGKSSLVKAGLLPRLSRDVRPVYMEATADDTPSRLLRSLRRACPHVADDLDLRETLAAIRLSGPSVPGTKLLIVLDQFEQWLHARQQHEPSPLAVALRQCDGQYLQCLLTVRDDFWLAVSRFMRQVEVPLVEGHNSALVDLFDLRHARKVLMAMGRAFGALPENLAKLSKQQQAFLDQAIDELAEDGRVICVRIALLAEMMKGKPWTPNTLRTMGGAEGVGVVFLEETFSSRAAPPEHRLHQRAARAVLKSLLPEAGSDLKGHLRSHAQLRDVSGYRSRQRDFGDLIRILERDTRLLTPIDPDADRAELDPAQPAGQQPTSTARVAEATSESRSRYYQLTHDYLVPSLREWLTRKQKETRRGRAELRMAERAAVWTARPENRHLPSLWEWVAIAGLTGKRDRTDRQNAMMRRAAWYHALRVLSLVAILLLAGWVGTEAYNRFRARALVDALGGVDVARIRPVLDQVVDYRRWVLPQLRRAVTTTGAATDERLRWGLALFRLDGSQIDYLSQRMLGAGPAELWVLREELAREKDVLSDRMWTAVQDDRANPERRFRAACTLARFANPGDRRWPPVLDFVAEQLVATVRNNPDQLAAWRRILAPIGLRLVDPLTGIYMDAGRIADHSFAANLLVEYSAGQPDKLARLVETARPEHFAAFFSRLGSRTDAAVSRWNVTLDMAAGAEMAERDKESLAKRQANAATALLRLGRTERVWPLLIHRPDPRTRSYLTQRMAVMGVDPAVLARRLQHEPDVSARRALVLSLGQFRWDQLPPSLGDALVKRLIELFRKHPDAGLHGAAEWTLRRWGQDRPLTATAGQRPGLARPDEQRQWFVNGQGHTMVILGPDQFLMGSPPGEKGRYRSERRHQRRIPRRFAIAIKEVTVEQFQTAYREILKEPFHYRPKYTVAPDGPQTEVNWYLAALYCNWLSVREGIAQSQWCYEPGPSGKFDSGTTAAEGHLQRIGYRLPTTAEWEYACRAGAITSRYFGETDELLPEYAWYGVNSAYRAHRVGLLKPNDFGLFDVLGNVQEWCDQLLRYPLPGESVKDDQPFDGPNRPLRGGSWSAQAPYVRAALRYEDPPQERNANYGFRVAKTIPADGT